MRCRGSASRRRRQRARRRRRGGGRGGLPRPRCCRRVGAGGARRGRGRRRAPAGADRCGRAPRRPRRPRALGPVLVDDGVEATLERYTELAPLHNRPALAESGPHARRFPACRTSRSSTPGSTGTCGGGTDVRPAAGPARAPRAAPLRLPRHLLRVRRPPAGELGVRPARRTVVCHLGARASVTAIRDGRSVDTSMGFTPLEGLVMATRSGDVDPGLLLYLLRTPASGEPWGAR